MRPSSASRRISLPAHRCLGHEKVQRSTTVAHRRGTYPARRCACGSRERTRTTGTPRSLTRRARPTCRCWRRAPPAQQSAPRAPSRPRGAGAWPLSHPGLRRPRPRRQPRAFRCPGPPWAAGAECARAAAAAPGSGRRSRAPCAALSIVRGGLRSAAPRVPGLRNRVEAAEHLQRLGHVQRREHHAGAVAQPHARVQEDGLHARGRTCSRTAHRHAQPALMPGSAWCGQGSWTRCAPRRLSTATQNRHVHAPPHVPDDLLALQRVDQRRLARVGVAQTADGDVRACGPRGGGAVRGLGLLLRSLVALGDHVTVVKLFVLLAVGAAPSPRRAPPASASAADNVRPQRGGRRGRGGGSVSVAGHGAIGGAAPVGLERERRGRHAGRQCAVLCRSASRGWHPTFKAGTYPPRWRGST
jgi:hypothetical protein